MKSSTESKTTATGRFLATLFGKEADKAWVTGFKQHPYAPGELKDKEAAGKLAAQMWGGGLYRAKKARLTPDANQYIAISLFKQGEDATTRRRKANFVQMRAVMVDDIGPKIDPKEIKLPLTIKVETSPGNCQGWYALDPTDPDTRDADLCARLIERMVAAGLTKDLTDPGMKGVTRYGRLPEGVNNKLGRDPWKVVMREHHPKRLYTIAQIAEAYGLDLTAPPKRNGTRQEGHGEASADSLVDRLAEAGLNPTANGEGKFNITCPWIADHTDEVDSGTAYFEPGESNGWAGGFKCHHGHCVDTHGIGDLYRWLDARAPVDHAAKLRDALKKMQLPAPEAPPTKPGMIITIGDELMRQDFAPVEQIFTGALQLTPGVTMLAGKPKHGKSWLAMGIALAVATGEAYMDGQRSSAMQAMYVSCDDPSKARFKRRIHAFAPKGALGGFMLVTDIDPHVPSVLDMLGEVITAHPALRLVVIDTLAAYRQGQRTENPYQQEFDEVKAINDWAHHHNIAVLLVHHLRKGEVDVTNPYESISGTLGLQGAVDGMMVLARKDLNSEFDSALDEKLAGLWYRHRDLDEEQELGIKLKDGRWSVIGSVSDVFQAGTAREIIAVLEARPTEWMTSKEIHAAGGFDCQAKSVQRAATRLVKKGLILSHQGSFEGAARAGGAFKAKP